MSAWHFSVVCVCLCVCVAGESSSASECESDEEGSSCSSSSDSDVFDVIAEIKRKKAHPDRLHEELWYNDPGQVCEPLVLLSDLSLSLTPSLSPSLSLSHSLTHSFSFSLSEVSSFFPC